MKKVKLSALALVLLATAGSATAAETPDYAAQAEQAKVELGQALYKMSVLTDSLTDQGKKNPNVAYDLATSFTDIFDKAIGDGINAGGTCDQVITFVRERALPTLTENLRNYKDKNGRPTPKPLLDKFLSRFEPAAISYMSNRCAYLTE